MSNSIRILVADDNFLNRQVLSGMLQHAGYTVNCAHDGQETIERLAEAQYDLLILDCMMPVMNGFEAARLIRKSDGSKYDPNIPILAVTALATEDDQEKCLESGMDDYITKPVDASLLFSRIRNLLSDAQSSIADTTRIREVDDLSGLGSATPIPGGGSVGLDKVMLSMSATIIEDTNLWISDLQRLEESGDSNQLTELAHKIRGTADLLGDTRLSAAARAVESSSKEQTLDAIREQIAALAAELGRLVFELREMLGPEKPEPPGNASA